MSNYLSCLFTAADSYPSLCCATCLCVKENRESGGNEEEEEEEAKDGSLDFSVLVPGGVTMCTQQCTSDGNSTWGCHH